MKPNNIDIDKILKEAEGLLKQEKDLSPALKSMFGVLIMVVKLLANSLGLNSRNSSKPPSSDPNREKESRKKSDRKPGGQKGRTGTTLRQIEEPDKVQVINVDRRTLPKGRYQVVGFEKRQVFDIDISRLVTEYQAEVLESAEGKRFVASFPEGVTKAVQYGNNLKAHAVYMSQYQLLPYNRIEEYFSEQLRVPVSSGSLFNFNREAFDKLASFDVIVKDKLAAAKLAHTDETGINIDGKRRWLHVVSNDSWTYFSPQEKRGKEAMDEIGILPRFRGVLCHDHWKPYYQYRECLHSLCNSHHLRELTRAWEQDNQRWARQTKELLEELNREVKTSGGQLEAAESDLYRKRYRGILAEAERECPPPEDKQRKGKRGRIKRSKSRNLLERLINYEEDVLRFMDDPAIPFTNNQGENDIRMTKVQQKISGCFRSLDGAQMFCRIRSYLSSCRKQDISSSLAMEFLFKGEMPEFI
ncbi:MAG: IS66 family transposase, partial [Desulfuromonadales bacterium]|nr:IS66 family transposase [Desulfuromonadales bacterium]